MCIDTVILSCEHAGAVVPSAYRHLFRSGKAQRALRTHRGQDLGALAVAQHLARRFGWPLYVCRTTRLLVDVNRSIGHRTLFSEFSAGLDRASRRDVLSRHYAPHRDAVTAAVERAIRSGRGVLHVSVHTFTPRLRGQTRQAEIGLLYDPSRRPEKQLCDRWSAALRSRAGTLRIRRNYPYRGTSDGLTTTLRRRFGPAAYVGVEVELNQRLTARPGPGRTVATRVLEDSLAGLVGR